MIKIYITGNWGISSRDLADTYKIQTPNNSGIWNDLELTYNEGEADYVIVQDGTNVPVKDMSKVIFFGREPRHVHYFMWDKNKCHSTYHHEDGNAWLPQTWWVRQSYNDLKKLKPNKTKKFSIIDSGREPTDNHRNRVNLINKFISKYPNDVDVWGKITNGRENITPFKTPLPNRSKDDGLLPYRYSLAIENGSTDYYFSEKIIDPLLCWSMPLYHGCKKIIDFLPEGSYINIDINSPTIENDILEIINSDVRERNIDKIREARELIMEKYNIWPTIERSVKDKKLF